MSEFETQPGPKQTRELLVEHPVFFHAHEFQRELEKLGPLEAKDALRVANQLADKLNLVSLMDEVFGKPVRMAGEKIVVPMPLPDYRIGAADIIADTLTRNDAFDFSELAVNGNFFGFTPFILPTDDTKSLYYAHLGYQVAISETIHLPTFYGTLLAYSGISDASLEFVEDKQKKDVKQATSVLETVEHEPSLEVITEINSLLLGKDRYHYENLHKISQLIRRRLGNKNPHITDQHRDALLDLVRARLDLYSEELFYIHAVSTIEKTTNELKYIIRPRTEVVLPIKALTYAPYYWNFQDKWQIQEDQYTLSVVVEMLDHDNESKRLINVPFEKLYELRPAGITNPNFIR